MKNLGFELNWTYFIVYTNTNGLNTSFDNVVKPLQKNLGVFQNKITTLFLFKNILPE